MNFLKWIVWCGLGLITSFSIQAQISDTVKKWSLETCFQYAIENNIDINTAKLNALTSVQDANAAKGIKIPDLYGSLNNTFTSEKTAVSGDEKYVNQVVSSGNYSLNSSLILWNGNYVNTNIHQKNLVSETNTLTVEQSKNNLILLITQGYLSVLLAKENLKYITDLVVTSQSRLKQGQQLYDAGSTAKISVLQLQAQLASDEYLKIQTENTIRQNILSLKQFLQLPTTTPFDVQTPKNLEVVTLISPLETVQNNAIQNFPEVKIGQMNMDISTLNITKAKASFMPTLTANAGIGTGYNDVLNHSYATDSNYFTQTGNNFYQQIGLGLSIPILSNQIHKTNLEKAKISYKQADFNFKNTKLVLSQQVELAFLNANDAQQAYQSANDQLIAVTESYRILNEEYKLGGINAFDLLQQKNQYLQAIQAFTQSKYTAILQQKIYNFYNGTKIQL
jgi:outer membrane protein